MRALTFTPIAGWPMGPFFMSCARSPLPTAIRLPLGLLLPGLPLLTRDAIEVM